LDQRVRLSAENRRVILAAAERTDAPLAGELAVRQPVLDRTEVFGKRRRGGECAAICGARGERVDSFEN